MASENKAEIQITADVAQFNAEMERAAQTCMSVTQKMQSTFRDASASIASEMKKTRETIDKTRESMLHVAEAAGLMWAGEKLVESAKQAAEYGDQIERAAQKTGMGAESLQGLKFAAQMTDVSFESLQVGLGHLSRSMMEAQQGGAQAAAGFKTVGISADQLKSMKMEDVLKQVADKFQSTQDGAAKTAIAMQLFGKSGAELVPLLNKGSSGLDELTNRAKELGIVLDEKAIQQSAAFNDQLKEVAAKGESTTRALGAALMPAITSVSNAFLKGSAQGGAMKQIFEEVGQGAVLLVDGVSYLAQIFQGLGIVIGGVAASINLAVHGDFVEAGQTLKSINSDLDANVAKFRAFRDELSKPVKLAEGKEERQGKGQLQIKQESSGKYTRLAKWREELDQMKDAEGVYHEMSKAEEIKFWQAKLEITRSGTKEHAAVLHELVTLGRADYQEQLKEAKKAADEKVKMEVDAASKQAELSRLRLKEQQQTDEYLLKSGKISEEEKAKRDLDAMNAEYKIQRDLLQKKLEIYAEDAKNKQAAQEEIQKLDAQHNLQLQKNAFDTSLAMQKSFQDAMKPITQAFDTSIKGMIMGTQTWQKATSNIFQSIVGESVNMGVQMVTKWVANEMAKTAATISGVTVRTGAEQAGNATGLVSSAASIVKSIMNDSAKTFSGVFAALSGIPIIGPALAASSAPAAAATVAAVSGSVASSAGGDWQIPSDRLNFVHKNETILPADKSKGLDDLIKGGGNGGAIHIHGSSSDKITVDQLKTMLRQMGRSFVPVN